MARAARGCPAIPAPVRRPVTSLIGSLRPGRALASRLAPCCLGWERQGYLSAAQWSLGVGHGVDGAGEVHPSGRRRWPPHFLAS